MSPVPAVPGAGNLESLGIDPAWSRRARVTLAEGHEVEVHALVTGPARGGEGGPTVVCVHGNPTWSFMWRSFLRRLGDRYDVIAVDQVSMGLSERTGPRRYAQRVDDLGRILAAFGIDGPVVLAAHDWGGPIALGWAVEHAERVRGVLLCNTGIAMPASGVPPLIRLAGSRALRDLGCRRTATFVRGTVAIGGGRIPKPVRSGYLSPYRSAASRSAIADFVADIPTTPFHPSYAALQGVASRLPDLDMPVLLVWGERDPVFHLEFAADLRRSLPRADLHRFPLAGHLVVEDEDVAAVADAWLERLAAQSVPAVTRGHTTTPEALWDALAAREDDGSTAIAVGGGPSVSFAALAQRVADLATGLRKAGVETGDRVAVLAPDPPDFIAAAYACWAVGAVTVVVDRGLGLRGLARALRSAEPAWLVGTGKTLGAARALRWVPSARRLDISSLAGDGTPLSAVTADVDPDATAAVVFTSGATGPAKGVVYSARQMTAQYEAVRDHYAIGAGDRLVAAFAPFALYGPALGIPVAVPDCDITEPASLRADALAAACASIDATILFAAPAALDGVLATRADLSPDDLEALGRLRARSLCRSAGPGPNPARVCRARTAGRASYAVRDDRGSLGVRRRPDHAGQGRPRQGCLRRTSVRRGSRAHRAVARRRRRDG